MATQAATFNLGQISRNGLGAPVLLVMMLAMIIIPLPPIALDMFFTFNITLSLVILMVTIYALRPLDFGVFPTVLLVVTLLRLALNVASTRVVLLNGHTGTGSAGKGGFSRWQTTVSERCFKPLWPSWKKTATAITRCPISPDPPRRDPATTRNTGILFLTSAWGPRPIPFCRRPGAGITAT